MELVWTILNKEKNVCDPELPKRSSLVIRTGLDPISDDNMCLKSELASVPYSDVHGSYD